MDIEAQPTPTVRRAIPSSGQRGLPNVQQRDVDDLPAETPGDWHVELRYLPIFHRGTRF